MTAILPFRLKVSGKDEFKGLHAVSTSYRFRGFLRLEGALLTIEWSGIAQIQDVGALTIRDDQLPLPEERLTVPASQLYRVTLEGGWWRPRLTLQASGLGTLAVVPSEEHGLVRFWYARADRPAAELMAKAINDAIAAAAKAALPPGPDAVIHESSSTPQGGLPSGGG
jgi:hypothetical protein